MGLMAFTYPSTYIFQLVHDLDAQLVVVVCPLALTCRGPGRLNHMVAARST